MESGKETTPSTPYRGGVGGKVRKPTTRKPPPTPYARPERNQSQRRWLSKFVDPAYRLIAGGATRLLPSLFSKSLPSNALPSSSDEDHDKREAEVEDNASGEDAFCNQGISAFPGPSGEANRAENNSNFNGHQKDKSNDSLAGLGNFDIEQLIRGKTFSRDEVSRLVEIIQSRALEPSNKGEDKKYPPLGNEKQAKQPVAVNKVLELSHEEKYENSDRARWGNITPRPLSSKLNEVGASPADIARAYMSNRKSETGPLTDKVILNDETALVRGDHMSKPFIPSLSPSTCWPGAMSENHRGYLTPSSHQRGFGLHNFPRTPYSRSIFTKSKSKGDPQNSVNTQTPLWQQSRTRAYDQIKSSNDLLDGATGSIGPIRRIRHKSAAVTRSRGSAYVYSTSQQERKMESSNISNGFSIDTKKNLEPGGPSSLPLLHSVGNNSSESSVLTVLPQSSQVARTILEHINRNPPTPKEKTEELKRAIAWKKTPASDGQSVLPNGTNIFALEFNSREKANQVDWVSHAQLSDKGKTMVSGVSDAANNNSSDMKFSLHNSDLINSSAKDVPKIFPGLGSKGETQVKPSPAGTKPVFPSITINKPESRWAFSSDSNTSGFTFPVSAASSGVLSEPPTPSILPSSSARSGPHPSKAENAVPPYRFGSKKSSPPLVFSFPSINSDPKSNDTLDIKFSFGSDGRHTRLAFGTVGKDAVCC